QEDARVELGACADFRAFKSKSLLQVLFIADQHIDVLDDLAKHFMSTLGSADSLPELLAIVQIERADNTGSACRFERFDQQLGGRFGQSGEDSAAMEPANALTEDGLPVKVARLQQRSRFVAAVVEHHR